MHANFSVPPPLAQHLRPRRSFAASCTPLRGGRIAGIYAQIAADYAKRACQGGPTHKTIFGAGLEVGTDATLLPIRAAAHALLSAPGAASVRAADIDALAAAAVMLARVTRHATLVPAIAVTRGVPDAVRVAVRSTYFQLAATAAGWTKSVFVTRSEPCPPGLGAAWLLLRHEVCAAPEAIYTTAVETARDLRAELDPMRRALVAFLFPDEPWANDDLVACDAAAPPAYGGYEFLLSAASSIDAVRAHVASHGARSVAQYSFDLAAAFPAAEIVPVFAQALVELLQKPKYGPLLKTPPRQVALALTCFRETTAATVLAPYAANAILGPIVLGYFRDAPELAADVGGAAPTRSKARGKLEETVDRALARRSATHEIFRADDGEIPAVLRERPWRARKGAGKTADEVVTGLTMLGLDRERVIPSATSDEFEARKGERIRAMTDAELRKWRTALAQDSYACVDYELQHVSKGGSWVYLRVPDAEGLAAWNQGHRYSSASVLAFVAKHGLASIPGFLTRDWLKWLEYEGDDGHFAAARHLLSPRIAPAIARVAARRKRYRRDALAWLTEHAEIAAFGLVFDAVGPAGEPRKDAEAALLDLAARDRADAVRAAARAYGPDVERVISALLARDPLAIDATVPKSPPFLRPAELTHARLRSGPSLGPDAHAALLEMLQIAGSEGTYPGISLVRDACDPGSLGAFATDLADQWVLADAPGRHEWMLFATARFASDQGTRRVGALAREWARKDGAKAARACAALAAIASDAALMHLAHVAETTRFDALRKTAAALLEEAAEARGLSLDELGDRTVPDVGLDAGGTVTLSYGPRAFTVSLDESLSPVVRARLESGAVGEVMKTLPRPGKTDDPVAAAAARERFDALKVDLAQVADRQLRRLERAMAAGRRWTLAEFVARVATQPLLLHPARRLVWEALAAGRPAQTFRVTEDGTYADEKDDAVVIASDATVRLAHPARGISPAWAGVLADYQIVQPFEQLGRASYAPTPTERAATSLARTAGASVPARKLLGTMESRGWKRDNTGHITSYSRDERTRDGERVVVRLPISPGMSMEDLANAPVQLTGALTLEARSAGALTLDALDAVSFSEVVRDVEAVRALR